MLDVVTIDDGFADGDTWFFSDKPLYVRNAATDRSITLQAADE